MSAGNACEASIRPPQRESIDLTDIPWRNYSRSFTDQSVDPCASDRRLGRLPFAAVAPTDLPLGLVQASSEDQPVDSLLEFKSFFFLKEVQENFLSFLSSGSAGSTEHLLGRHGGI